MNARRGDVLEPLGVDPLTVEGWESGRGGAQSRARAQKHAGLGVQCSSSPVSPTLEETARRWDWFVQVVVAATQYDVPVMAVPVSIVVARCQVQPVRDYSDGALEEKRAIFKRQTTYSQVVHLCQN